MKFSHQIIFFTMALWGFLFSPVHAYNLRQISNRDGLSNSSVICLFQDVDRFLWIGTYDGLDMYDGRDIHIYKPNINNINSLSGNVIRQIIETNGDFLWISTKWGLNKLSKRRNIIEERYVEFKENSRIAKDKQDNLYVFNKDGTLYFYNQLKNKFTNLRIDKSIDSGNEISFFIANDTIYLAYATGIIKKYTIDLKKTENPKVIEHADYIHSTPIIFACCDKGKIIFVDKKGNLYLVNSNKTIFIRNISPFFKENKDISSIIFDGKDIFIGLTSNGLIHLHSAKNYEPERININCGVYSLWKDEDQDIVWIGTDGQGVYTYTKDEYIFNNLILNQLPIKKERPIRAIHTDHLDNLWLGTKNNGIIRIRNYSSTNDYSSQNVSHFTTNEGLNNNAIFAFALSTKNNVLWIGSDGPALNYYSYYDKKMHTLINNTSTQFVNVHALFEATDSVLWIGSGDTLLKVNIQRHKNKFETNLIQRFTYDIKNKYTANQIFSLYPENDSIIWIGIRGNGVVRFNTITKNYKLITFGDKIGPMNDILCIHQDKNKTFWFGSSYGLIRFKRYQNGQFKYKNYNENEGLFNNTIHGILENTDGKLWLSTNSGIVLFDPIKETFRSFNQKTGLKTIEFCDNAYFEDKQKMRFFFGGVDGMVWISHGQPIKRNFLPDIFFTKLRIFNQERNIYDFIKKRGQKQYIELTNRQNSFTVSFVAMDFINGENSNYSYKLENFSDIWMDIRANEAQFTNIPPGDYILKVKYNDGIGNNENQVQSILIKILPPWYMTIYAKIFYILLFITFIALAYLYIKRKYEKKKRKIARELDQKYKEEMYESKLRFFTNITHEFCTPLSLIYGPSELISNYKGSDSFIKKYAQIIKSNTKRLNNLIQEIIDFRRIETGNRICYIQRLNISEIIAEITESFIEISERNNINFKTQIAPNIMWNTDLGCFTKIVNNLISNAFKYTPPKGDIEVKVDCNAEMLVLKIYNTGKGISKENIPLIFNRYTILNNIKENTMNGLSSRNGLGLAICQSMTELLQGKIEVKSEVNQYVQFTINLPHLDANENTLKMQSPNSFNELSSPYNRENPNKKKNQTLIEKKYTDEIYTHKAKILIIDDNHELLNMIKDILSDEYTVLLAEDGQIGLQMLTQSTPDLIITDIMMPNMDGISLTKHIKQNKHTVYIPLVILSAKTTTDERIEGIESGADAYIPKPFDPQYLKTVIRHLMKSKKNLEEYYNTSASAYDFRCGQLLKKEDKLFLQTVVQIIDKNIDNIEFSPEDLANGMQISIRNLYRKFKDLDQLPPRDFIKEQRINHAVKLLLTTNLTIQEIMYAVGFSNRSHFYKEFSKRYKQTPKEYREVKRLDENLSIT